MDIVEQATKLKDDMATMSDKKRRLANDLERLQAQIDKASGELTRAAEVKQEVEEMLVKRQKLTAEHEVLQEKTNEDSKSLSNISLRLEQLSRLKPDSDGDAVLRVNVGGHHFTAYRSTFLQIPDSLLATMVSSRWSEGVRQEDGALFFDMDPKAFEEILCYLRAMRAGTAPAQIFSRQASGLAEYLGVTSPMNFTFDGRSAHPFQYWHLKDGDTVAECTYSGGTDCVIYAQPESQLISKSGTARSLFRWSFQYLSGDPNVSIQFGMETMSWCPDRESSILLSSLQDSQLNISRGPVALGNKVCRIQPGDTMLFAVDVDDGSVTVSINRASAVRLVRDAELFEHQWRAVVKCRRAGQPIRVGIASLG